MNLYLDASALVKLYVEEEGRLVLLAALRDTEVVATSILAYVEARAAFARRRREGVLSLSGHRRCVRDLERDWPHYMRFEVSEPLVHAAARVAERYQLAHITPCTSCRPLRCGIGWAIRSCSHAGTLVSAWPLAAQDLRRSPHKATASSTTLEAVGTAKSDARFVAQP